MPTFIKDSSQHQFIMSKAYYCALIGGYRSGKSFALLWKTLLLAVANPGCSGLVVSNLYSQMTLTIIPQFISILNECNISYVESRSEHTISFLSNKIIFKSAEGREAIVGFEVAFAACDEACLYDSNVFINIQARISDKKAKQRQMIFASTPEGMGGWVYENFVKTKLPDSELYYASMKDNAANLAPGYVDQLMHSFPSKYRQAYIDGEFVDLSADAVYYAFERAKHVADKWLISSQLGNADIAGLRLPEIYLSCDFGSAYGCWTLSKKMMSGGKVYWYVFDEIFQKQTNTEEMAKELVTRYGNQGYSLHIVGDATGGHNRSSIATKTDYQILEWYIKNHFERINFENKSHNPPIRDRINTFNLCLHGDARFEMRISPKCKYLIEDLLQTSYAQDGSNRLDKNKNGGSTTHMTDSLGYMLMQQATPIDRFGYGRGNENEAKALQYRTSLV